MGSTISAFDGGLVTPARSRSPKSSKAGRSPDGGQLSSTGRPAIKTVCLLPSPHSPFSSSLELSEPFADSLFFSFLIFLNFIFIYSFDNSSRSPSPFPLFFFFFLTFPFRDSVPTRNFFKPKHPNLAAFCGGQTAARPLSTWCPDHPPAPPAPPGTCPGTPAPPRPLLLGHPHLCLIDFVNLWTALLSEDDQFGVIRIIPPSLRIFFSFEKAIYRSY